MSHPVFHLIQLAVGSLQTSALHVKLELLDDSSSLIDPYWYLTFTYDLQGLFPPGQGATIGVDFMIKTVEIDGEKVKVRIMLIRDDNSI